MLFTKSYLLTSTYLLAMHNDGVTLNPTSRHDVYHKSVTKSLSQNQLFLSGINTTHTYSVISYCKSYALSHAAAVYAYHCYSYLFWSDGNDGNGSNAQIGRSELSGKNRTALVTSAQGLVSPTTLVVDFSTQKLYWLDSGAEKIGRINIDGSQLFTQTISSLSQMSAMTIYRVRTF